MISLKLFKSVFQSIYLLLAIAICIAICYYQALLQAITQTLAIIITILGATWGSAACMVWRWNVMKSVYNYCTTTTYLQEYWELLMDYER